MGITKLVSELLSFKAKIRGVLIGYCVTMVTY